MSNDYDPRYPFGFDKKTKDEKNKPKQAQSTKAGETQTQAKSSAKNAKKSQGVKNILITLAVLGLVGGGTWGVYELMTDEPQQVTTTLPNEPVLHCPVFNPAPVKASYDERRCHSYVKGTLAATRYLSDDLDDAVAREVLDALSCGVEKYEAIGMAHQNLQQGIRYDVGHQPDGIGDGLIQLYSNIPTTGIQARDVGRVMGAASFRMCVVASNLDAYSADEAVLMLKRFGGLMANPDLGREAVQEANQNPDWAIEAQKKVIRKVHSSISSNKMPHEAVCDAIDSVFGQNTNMLMAFYTYAQTMHILNGKTKTQMLGALGQNLEQLKEYPEGWLASNSVWLSKMTPARSNVRLNPANTNGGR